MAVMRLGFRTKQATIFNKIFVQFIFNGTVIH